jgi:hypothetical protein
VAGAMTQRTICIARMVASERATRCDRVSSLDVGRPGLLPPSPPPPAGTAESPPTPTPRPLAELPWARSLELLAFKLGSRREKQTRKRE